MYLKSIMELWRTTTSRAWRMSYITFSKDTTRCPCRSNAMLLKLFRSRSVEPPSASRELFVFYLSSSKWTGTHKAIIFFFTSLALAPRYESHFCMRPNGPPLAECLYKWEVSIVGENHLWKNWSGFFLTEKKLKWLSSLEILSVHTIRNGFQ